MVSEGDGVLYIISARGSLSWEVYKRVFDAVCLNVQPTRSLDEIRLARYETVKSLSALGHVDFSFQPSNLRAWAAAPTMTRIPFGGDPHFILSGARTPHTRKAIETRAARSAPDCIISEESSGGQTVEGPLRIAVKATNAASVERLANELRIGFQPRPAALTLSELAFSIDDYLAQLAWKVVPELSLPTKSFDASSLRMDQAPCTYSHMRFSSYEDSRTGRSLDVLWWENRQAELDRDWARWVILRAAGRSGVLYDPKEYLLGVPVGAPLPALLARAAVMCSGYAPAVLAPFRSRSWEDRILSYQLVPPNVAQLISLKLRQPLVSQPLNKW
jgi:hypothetical protein